MAVKHRIIQNPSGYHSHGKSHKEKLINFALFIKEFGWSGKWNDDEETGILHLNATRGSNEKIDIEWPEKQSWPDVWYTYAGNSIKCRNISQAAKIGQDPPDPDRMRMVSRRRRRPKRNGIDLHLPEGAGGVPLAGDELIAELATTLPFDKESSAEELKSVLLRHTITWVNRISGNVQTETIKPKHFKITEKDGRKTLHFCSDYGFRSVYVDSIIGVG